MPTSLRWIFLRDKFLSVPSGAGFQGVNGHGVGIFYIGFPCRGRTCVTNRSEKKEKLLLLDNRLKRKEITKAYIIGKFQLIKDCF